MSWYPLAAHEAGPVPLQPGPSAPADRRGALARIRKPGAMVIRASLLGQAWWHRPPRLPTPPVARSVTSGT